MKVWTYIEEFVTKSFNIFFQDIKCFVTLDLQPKLQIILDKLLQFSGKILKKTLKIKAFFRLLQDN